MHQLLQYFGGVKLFSLLHSDIGTHTRPKLLAYFEDPENLRWS